MTLSSAAVLARATAVRASRPGARLVRVVHAPAGCYRPWWAQRAAAALEPGATFLLGVAGRGGGKTRHVLYRLLRRAALRPGEQSLGFWPDFPRARSATDELRAMAVPLGGEWQEQNKRLLLRNGHVVWIKSADDEDSPRGLHVTTLLVDEAALVDESAFTAALGCLTGTGVLVLITTTPRGRASWVYAHWRDAGLGRRPDVRRWMFRTQDSPYGMPDAVLASARASTTADRAAQEYDAAFTEDRAAPFPPEVVERLLSRRLAVRGERVVLGIDVAQKLDWMAVVRMNEHAEAWLLARWQHVDYPTSIERLLDLAEEHRATVAVDVHGGGGAGAVVADFLERGAGERAGLGAARVLRVGTASGATKARLVEALMVEVEHDVVRVDPTGALAPVLRHELLFFSSRREVHRGVERIVYEGPQVAGEHDDTVVALCLANHARVHGTPTADESGDGGLGSFRPFVAGPGGTTPGGLEPTTPTRPREAEGGGARGRVPGGRGRIFG